MNAHHYRSTALSSQMCGSSTERRISTSQQQGVRNYQGRSGMIPSLPTCLRHHGSTSAALWGGGGNCIEVSTESSITLTPTAITKMGLGTGALGTTVCEGAERRGLGRLACRRLETFARPRVQCVQCVRAIPLCGTPTRPSGKVCVILTLPATVYR